MKCHCVLVRTTLPVYESILSSWMTQNKNIVLSLFFFIIHRVFHNPQLCKKIPGVLLNQLLYYITQKCILMNMNLCVKQIYSTTDHCISVYGNSRDLINVYLNSNRSATCHLVWATSWDRDVLSVVPMPCCSGRLRPTAPTCCSPCTRYQYQTIFSLVTLEDFCTFHLAHFPNRNLKDATF